jgi:hypothetical protein
MRRAKFVQPEALGACRACDRVGPAIPVKKRPLLSAQIARPTAVDVSYPSTIEFDSIVGRDHAKAARARRLTRHLNRGQRPAARPSSQSPHRHANYEACGRRPAILGPRFRASSGGAIPERRTDGLTGVTATTTERGLMAVSTSRRERRNAISLCRRRGDDGLELERARASRGETRGMTAWRPWRVPILGVLVVVPVHFLVLIALILGVVVR